MTWEERGGFMSRGAYILEIRRFLILYTVSLLTKVHLEKYDTEIRNKNASCGILLTMRDETID